MPPARKTNLSYYVIDETASKKPRPHHVINLKDLISEKNIDSKFHLTVKINKDSPENITIKRSGPTLTVDTMGKGMDPVSRQYEIPEDSEMEKFGYQISKEGLLTISGPNTKRPGNVVPIHIEHLPQMNLGELIRLKGAGWNKCGPMKFRPSFIKGVMHCSLDTEMEEGKVASDEAEMMENDESSGEPHGGQNMDVVPDNPPT